MTVASRRTPMIRRRFRRQLLQECCYPLPAAAAEGKFIVYSRDVPLLHRPVWKLILHSACSDQVQPPCSGQFKGDCVTSNGPAILSVASSAPCFNVHAPARIPLETQRAGYLLTSAGGEADCFGTSVAIETPAMSNCVATTSLQALPALPVFANSASHVQLAAECSRMCVSSAEYRKINKSAAAHGLFDEVSMRYGAHGAN